MEKKEIFEKLNENVQELGKLESNIAMVELAIYQKSIKNLKNEKLNETKAFFEQQASGFGQISENFSSEIDEKMKKYESQIDMLITAYDNLYLNTFKAMQGAMNNQKIAIANIVTLMTKLEKLDNDEKEAEKLRNTIIACATQKLNYSVIIDECVARLKWCIENAQNDINEVFVNNVYQLQIYNENIFTKIKKMIYNKISGKNRFIKFLESYENKYLKETISKNNLKILNVTAILGGVVRQMEETQKQISIKYKQMVGA